jgi:site-specific DNA-methyltransferase (adenine-specific)
MKLSEVYNCDCFEYMKSLPDKYFELCIADPPYGINASTEKGRLNSGSGKLKDRVLNRSMIDWDNQVPSKEYFDELFRVSKNQIIWGGNYFDLPPTRGIICWDKCQPWENFSQIEMAWTSFDYPAKLYRFDNRTTDKIHPTQKPIALYAWILDNYAKQGDKIFDPFIGSGSSRIAAYKKGFDFYGCELDKDYYQAQEERFSRECFGEVKLTNGVTIKQTSLFEL